MWFTSENGDEILPFIERKSFDDRKREVDKIKLKYPDKVPLIIERYRREKYLPLYEKTKFLIDDHMTMAELIAVLRKRMRISENQAIYLLVDNSLPNYSNTLSDIYRDYKNDDGFLYVTYASEDVFGQ